VVWAAEAQNDDDEFGIFGQRYAATGAAAGGEFHVNFVHGRHTVRVVGRRRRGRNFVVVWESGGVGATNVSGQRFTSAGVPAGSEFQVNTFTTTSFNRKPAVASDASGNFVVVWWQEVGITPTIFTVWGRRVREQTGPPAGGGLHGERLHDGYHARSHPSRPTMLGTSWWSWSEYPGGVPDVVGRRFDNTGAAVGGQFQVNTYTTGSQYQPVVSSDAAGNFVVVWSSASPERGGDRGPTVHERRRGHRRRVRGAHLHDAHTVNSPSIASTPTATSSWSGRGTTGSEGSSMAAAMRATARRTAASSRCYGPGPVGPAPTVAADAAGDFTIAWVRDNNTIFARRYLPIGRDHDHLNHAPSDPICSPPASAS
jgi:hypothetical protein